MSEFISSKREAFKEAIAIGTDGEENIIKAFSESCPTSTYLRCFIHFRDNVKEKMKSIGIDEANRKMICAEMFGIQNRTIFEEGIADSGNNQLFNCMGGKKMEKRNNYFINGF